GANPVECFHHPVFELYYRPLFTATFALRDMVYQQDLKRGRETRWYHAENLILHAAVCATAFWFFFLLFQKERRALLAGLVFTLHPLQVTVTTFIGGRPDSMALLFLLLFSIGAWNSTKEFSLPTMFEWPNAPRPASPDSSWRRFGWFLLSLFAYTCAVFTKEQCISMLLVLPLLLWRRGFAFPKQNLPLLALYFVPIVLYIRAAKQIIPFNTVSNPQWSTWLHTEMIGRTLWYFERLLLFPMVGPFHQSTLGPWDTPQPAVALTGYLLCFVWLALIWKYRNNPTIRFCALWTSLTLFPCLNLIPIPSQFASVYRAAIPLLGFAGLLGMALDKLFDRWQLRMSSSDKFQTDQSLAATLTSLQTRWRQTQWGLAFPALLVLVVYYNWETVADVHCWRNNATLMDAEIYGDPNFIPAYGGKAFGYETTAQWDKVEQNFDSVISAFMPTGPADEKFAAAVKSPACQRALWSHAGLRYHPVGYLSWILPHRGWARQEQAHYAAAAEDYKRALLLNPKDDNSRANLRDCYLANGQDVEAYNLYRNALEVPTRSESGTNHAAPKDR
ncbi:MAG: hypothetical protein JWN14_3186, partial [Chthonomonadales bacterium]|nr:hypothetical protein [Chthonomonadales bacterium]